MEAMSTIAEIDLKTYGRLLAKTTPVVIKSEEDNERMLAVVEKLMRKGEDKLTPEEDALLDLLLDLIHHFEEEHYPIPKSPPRGILFFRLEKPRVGDPFGQALHQQGPGEEAGFFLQRFSRFVFIESRDLV